MIFLGEAVRHGWNVVQRSKRMLLLVGFVDLLVCLPPTVYVLRNVDAVAARRVDALEIAKRFDPDFMADLRARAPNFDENLAALCFVSFVLFFLVRPFIAAGFVGLAATRRRVHFGGFSKEGGAGYWKFLRLALIAGLAAYLLSLAARPLLAQVREWAKARSEPTADRYTLVANVVVFASFCVASMIFEYARVGIRMKRRPGVLAELGRSTLFVLQHPARTLALLVISLGLEIGAVLAFSWFVQLADGGYLTTSAIVLGLVQITVTLREAARLFHVAGAWQIRAGDPGDERREPAVIAPEPDAPDVLRAPLPWNVR